MALSTPGSLNLTSLLNLTTAGSAVVIPMSNYKRLVLAATGLTASGASLAIDASRDDGATWPATGMTTIDYDTGAPLTSLSDDGDYRLLARGYTHVRMRVLTAGSGAVQLMLLPQDRPLDTLAVGPGPVSTGGAGPNPAQDGTDATGVTAPPGAVGIRGWLSGIFARLGRLAGVTSSTSTPSAVLATTTGARGNILPADAARTGFTLRNPSTTATMYILLGSTAATIVNWRYSIALGGRLDNEGWQGAVSAVWSVADGSQALVWSDTL